MIKRENPHLCVADIMKRVSQMWARMNKCDKKQYDVLSEIDKKRYEQDLANYRARKRAPA